jgi:hypothetical protein
VDSDEPARGWFVVAIAPGGQRFGTLTVTGCDRERAIEHVRNRCGFCFGNIDWTFEAWYVALINGELRRATAPGARG